MIDRWGVDQTDRAQARVMRAVTKAAVLVQYGRIYITGRARFQSEQATQVEVAVTEVAVQVQPAKVRQRSKAVQYEVATTDVEQQTEVGDTVLVVTQTEEVDQPDQTDTATVTEREGNPFVHGVEVSEELRSDIEEAVGRAFDWKDHTNGTVTSDTLVDSYFEVIQWSRQVPKAEQLGILTLLEMEYERQRMEMRIKEATNKAKCVQGSIGECTAKEASRVDASMWKARQTKPDKTAMLMKSVVRKDREIRSKELKIPWGQEAK